MWLNGGGVSKWFILILNGPFPAYFSYFLFNTDLMQLIESKLWQSLDLRHRSLISQATALPTEPQPFPLFCFFIVVMLGMV